jgi:hypothetical protein
MAVFNRLRLPVCQGRSHTRQGTRMTQTHTLRPEVLAFAQMMELRLREKDADKGTSWKEKQIIDLTVNVCTAARMIEKNIFPLNDAVSIKALVDMANHCMMLADVAGALGQAQ